MSKKIAIVTVLIGAYDSKLLEFEYDNNKYDFICYTNMKRLKSNTWDIRYVDELKVPGDNARSSYWYKWNPHKYLDKRKYDIMVWVDASLNYININELGKLISRLENNSDISLLIEKHPSRDTLVDETNANIKLNKDNIDNMRRQVMRYFDEGYDDKFTTMVETGLSIRKYKDAALIKLSENIWKEISPKENTKRDQLVFDYCVWKTGFKGYSLFTFEEKCKVVIFQDHPNIPNHKEKVLIVGPWFGEDIYEKQWVSYVKDYLSHNPVDTVVVICRDNRTALYDEIYPDKIITSDPDGVRDGVLLDGREPKANVSVSNDDKIIVYLSPTQKWLESLSYPTNILNVYYNYYVDKDPERNNELEFCLTSMINNQIIDNIYLLCDSDIPINVNDKCKIIQIENRPTYNDIFSIINNITMSENINMIINSDCFIDVNSAINIKNNIEIGEFWALSRKEIISKYPLIGAGRVNDYGSQDAWIIKGKIDRNVDVDFTMGVPGCDNKITYIMNNAGYVVLNPSLDVYVYHNHASQLRRYTEDDRINEPYLLADQCNSINKVKDTKIINNMSEYTKYISNHITPIYLSCVCTERVLNEFLILKYSMSLYNPEVKWILSTDKFVSDYFIDDPTVECFEWIKDSGSHRDRDKESVNNYINLVNTKLDLLELSIERYGYGFILDTDMIITNKFDNKFLMSAFNGTADIMVTDHTLKDKKLEDRVGKYNAGLVFIRNKKLLSKWKEITYTGEYFFEQKPLEVALQAGRYKILLFDDTYNVAYWKMNNNPSLTLTTGDNIRINNKSVILIHSHVLDKNINGDKQIGDFADVVMGILKNSINPNHIKIYNYILELNNENN